MLSAAIWSAMLGVEDATSINLLRDAARLESDGQSVSAEAVVDSGADRAFSTCRPSIVRAAVGVRFAELNQQSAARDRALWLAKSEDTGRMMDHALDCMPDDGGMWARQALLTQLRSGASDVVGRALGRSQALAPAEENILRTRLEAWTMMAPGAIEPVEAALHADVSVLLEHARPELLRLFLASLPIWMLPMVREEFGALPEPRRELAERMLPALGNWGAT